MSTKKRSFIGGATIIMVATIVAKIIGALYRIPLTNVLGAEGMGIYQLIFPVYSLILSVSSGALPIAISMLVSDKLAGGEKEDARELLSSALSALLMVGVALTLVLILLSGAIGRLQGSQDTSIGYVIIAPSILFVSGLSVMKGYFQGTANMFPTALSQIIEAVIKLVVGLALSYFLMRYGVKWAVAGGLLGVTIGEAMAFFTLYIMYRKANPPLNLSLDFKASKEKYKEILNISLPITIGGIVFPLTQMIDSFAVVNILSRSIQTGLATSYYGLYSGCVSSLINLPIVIGLSLGVAVVPHLSQSKASHDLYSIKKKTTTAIKISLIIGVPFAVLFFVAPDSLLGLLYSNLSRMELSVATRLLRISSITVIFLSVNQISTSVLQGLNFTKVALKNTVVTGICKVICDVIMLFIFGIDGVAYSSVVSYALGSLLNLVSITQIMGRTQELVKNTSVIALVSGIMGIMIYAVSRVGAIWLTMSAIAVFGVGYLFTVVMSNVFTEEEVVSLPMGKKIATIRRRIRRKS